MHSPTQLARVWQLQPTEDRQGALAFLSIISGEESSSATQPHESIISLTLQPADLRPLQPGSRGWGRREAHGRKMRLGSPGRVHWRLEISDFALPG